MQSLKEDRQFQHSTFLEYTIVLLIAFEVIVEVHALGWINWPPWMLRLTGQPASASAPPELQPSGAHGRGAKPHLLRRASSGNE